MRGRREAHLAEHRLDAPKPGQVRRARLYLQLVKALRDSSAIEHGYAVINEFGKLPAAGFSQGPAAASRPQSSYPVQFRPARKSGSQAAGFIGNVVTVRLAYHHLIA